MAAILKYTNKTQRMLLLAGVSLLILGMANILYGQHKIGQYVKVLDDSVTMTKTEIDPTPLPLAQNQTSVDIYRDQLSRVKTRIEFYELAVAGGRFFLVMGGISLVLAVLLFGKLSESGT